MLLLLLGCAITLANDNSEFTYSPERGGLSIQFPAKPVITHQSSERTEVDLSEARLEHNGMNFYASYSQLPKRMFEVLSKDEMIEAYLQSTPLNPKYGGQIVAEAKQRYGSQIFRVIYVQYSKEEKKPWTKLLVGVVNQNLVEIRVHSKTQEALKSSDANRFFDSLNIKVSKSK